MVYPANDSTSVNKSRNPVSLSLQKQVDGSFLASKVVASGKIGFRRDHAQSYEAFWTIQEKCKSDWVEMVSNKCVLSGHDSLRTWCLFLSESWSKIGIADK